MVVRQDGHDQFGTVFQQHDAHHSVRGNHEPVRSLAKGFARWTGEQAVSDLALVQVVSDDVGQVHGDRPRWIGEQGWGQRERPYAVLATAAVRVAAFRSIGAGRRAGSVAAGAREGGFCRAPWGGLESR